jgi:hypothetical protein
LAYGARRSPEVLGETPKTAGKMPALPGNPEIAAREISALSQALAPIQVLGRRALRLPG